MFETRKFRFLFMLVLTFCYIFISILFNVDIWRYNTVLCFPLGVLCFLYEREIRTILSNYYYIILFVSGILVSMLYYLVIRNYYYDLLTFICSLLICIFIYCFCYKVSIQSRFLYFVGDISYEFYILQLPIIKIIIYNFDDASWGIILILLFTLFFSFLCHKFSSVVNRLF